MEKYRDVDPRAGQEARADPRFRRRYVMRALVAPVATEGPQAHRFPSTQALRCDARPRAPWRAWSSPLSLSTSRGPFENNGASAGRERARLKVGTDEPLMGDARIPRASTSGSGGLLHCIVAEMPSSGSRPLQDSQRHCEGLRFPSSNHHCAGL